MPIEVDASYIGPPGGGEVGSSVAVSGNGQVFAFGNERFNAPGKSDAGNVVVGHVSDGVFVIDASYVGETGDDQVGYDVALNNTGDRIIFSSLNINKVYAGTVTGSEIVIDASLSDSGLDTELGQAVDINSAGDVYCYSNPSHDVNDGIIYVSSISEGEFANIATYVGTSDNIGTDVALNSAGDKLAFTSSDINRVYLGSISGESITIDASFNTSGLRDCVSINSDGDKVAFSDNPGTRRVALASVSGSSLVVDASINQENSGDRFGNSIAMNADGTKLITSAEDFDSATETEAGKVYLLSVSGSNLVVDASYIGEYDDSLGGAAGTDIGLRAVAISDNGLSYIFSEQDYDGTTVTGTDVGKVYFVIPDFDDDGIPEPTDIFLNQQLNVVPTAIPGLTNVFAIAPGKHHTLAITRDGRVLSFGRNQSGQLGRLLTDVSGHVPADVSGALNAYPAVRAGARLEGGDAYARADVIGSAEKNRALLSMLRLLRSSLEGESGFNAELADHYLANLSREYA
jgi:hypothetical protein